MSDRTVTVKPTGGDYDSLAAAITGIVGSGYGNLTVDNGSGGPGILTIEVGGNWSGSPDTATVLIDNVTNIITTSSAYYLKITADAANRTAAAAWSSSKYILQAANAHLIAARTPCDHVWIDGLQLNLTGGSAAGQSCIYMYTKLAGSWCRLSNIRAVGASEATNYLHGIRIEDADQTGYVWNCICSGFLGNSSASGYQLGAGSIYIYNSLAYNNYRGIRSVSGSNRVYNSVSFLNTTDFLATTNFVDVQYCAHDDAAVTNETNEVAESGGGANWPSDYTAAGSGDFTLVSGSNLIGATSDMSSGLFTDDMDGKTRGSVWDVGPSEYEDAGATPVSFKTSTLLGFGL